MKYVLRLSYHSSIICFTVISLFVLNGCVMVSLESDPEGADVYFNGKHLGTTPIKIPFAWFSNVGSYAEVVLPGYDREDCPRLDKPNPHRCLIVADSTPKCN